MRLDDKRKRLLELQKKIERELVRENKLGADIKRLNRKIRTRRLIEAGALFEKLGLLDCDREFLAGYLLEGKKLAVGSDEWLKFKNLGRKFFGD